MDEQTSTVDLELNDDEFRESVEDVIAELERLQDAANDAADALERLEGYDSIDLEVAINNDNND